MEGTTEAETEGLNGFPGGTWHNVGKCVERLTLMERKRSTAWFPRRRRKMTPLPPCPAARLV
jgi:hypothetical protein